MRLFSSWSSADVCVCVSQNHLWTAADATHLKCFCEVGTAWAAELKALMLEIYFLRARKVPLTRPATPQMMPLLLQPWNFLTIAIFGQTFCASRLIKQCMCVQHRWIGISCASPEIHSHYLFFSLYIFSLLHLQTVVVYIFYPWVWLTCRCAVASHTVSSCGIQCLTCLCFVVYIRAAQYIFLALISQCAHPQ